MATTAGGGATVNLVTSSTTTTDTRGITSITTDAGTNLSIVHVKLPFQKRVIESGKRFLFFLATQPKYLPNVGQEVLIHHTDLPDSSAIKNFFTAASTNVATGTFQRLAIMGSAATIRARDGFTWALDVMYDDDQLGYIPGDCNGCIEYDVSPLEYDILKPIESNVTVTERVPYDLSEGDNHLRSTTTGATQSVADIAPMLFVDRGDSNTVFSNLFQSFNLPVTTSQLKEFQQSTLGHWVDDEVNGTLYYNGKKGNWLATAPYEIIHPVTGYTGMFYNTVFEHLAQTRILVIEIPQAQYGEIIDGKSLKIRVPRNVIPSEAYYDCYGAYKANEEEFNLGKMDNYMSEHDLSASYFGAPPQLTDTAYESNVVLLFCDDIKAPQSGSVASWLNGHDEVMQGEKCYNPNSVVPKAFFDFYEDQPVGIAYLDRGFAVITDPIIVAAAYALYNAGMPSNTPTNVGIAANIIVNYDGVDIDWFNSQFLFKSTKLTTSNHLAEYLSYNTEKSMNVVCLASAEEFYRSVNDTAKELMNVTTADFAEFKNPVSGNLYPIVITEIGLHDAAGNLLAIVKPREPIKKYWYDVVSFNIKIRL